MKILDIINETDSAVIDEKASRKLCKGSTPNSKLGASNLASCKSQGLRARSSDTKKSQKVGKKRLKLAGKKLKSTQYGGPISPTRTG
jgi:hypothetical protein|tara:strand:+ start:703 stop:963 length:261 start_codon:yes stop_codon:yes gene_type:complete